MKKLKLPKFTLFFRNQKKIQATTATRRAPSSESYYEEEPKTNLSSAFIVVLVLHVVAVGGIYAFNSLRASRTPGESHSTASSTLPAIPKVNPSASIAENNPAPGAKGNTHRVQSGDTLSKIAAQYSVSVAEIEETNGAKNVALLRPGQIISIPMAKPAPKPAAAPVIQDSRKAAFLATKSEDAPAVAATANAAGRTYTVAKGDTPTSIAKKFGTNSVELLKLNKIDDPKHVQIGQVLKVPAKKN